MSVLQLLVSIYSGTGSKKIPFLDRVVDLSQLCTVTAVLLAALGSATQLHTFRVPWHRPTIQPQVGIPSCGFSPHHPLHLANLLSSLLFLQLFLMFNSCLLQCFFCMATARKIHGGFQV